MDQLVKFSSINIIHNEIERPRILLDAPQIHNEWMIKLLLKGHLIKDVINLFCLDYRILR
jgi:hypothetical protein